MDGARFESELMTLLNRFSAENGSDTPDFMLAAYLRSCLDNFNATVKAREKWYGRPCGDGSAILS